MTLIKTPSLSAEAPSTTTATNNDNNHRRILFLSLEFNYSPFSGNGVLCRSLVSGLLSNNNNNHHGIDAVEIRVICAKPHPSSPNLSCDIDMNYPHLEIWPVELPEGSSSDNKWKRLDRFGPWDEFKSAFTNSNDNDNNLLERIDEFEPTDVVAIDWHGMLAWQAIIASSTTTTMYNRWRKGQEVSVCYYNFRVYSSSSWGNDDDDAQFYQAMEQLACRMADGIICLSEHDKCALQQFLMQSDVIEEEKYTIPSGCQERKRREMTVLPPPLRGDVCELARMMTYPPIEQSSSSSLFDEYLPEQVREALDYIQLQTQSTTTNHPYQQQRVFLTCISRLSPEKTPHIFVNLLQQLGGVTFLRKHGLIPILCGARSVESYAEVVIQSLRNVCSTEDGGDEDDNYWRPCIVIDHHHLGPKELASIFSHTILNVHPCLYDAYGMTMVESSAFGVPSVVNCGGKVGAAALLGEGLGCVALDLSGLDYDDEEEVVTGSGKAAVAVASCSAARGGDEEEMDCSVKKVKEMLAPRIEQGDDLLESNDSSSSSSTLARVAKEARQRALGWDELSCSRGLLEKLNSLRIKTDEVERS